MRKRTKKKRNRKWIWLLLAIPVVWMTGSIGLSFVWPDVSKLRKTNPVKTSFMEYREDEWKSEGKNIRIRQRWVPLGRISPYVIKAVIIAEDDKFWRHEGFDYAAIQKAVEKDLKQRKFKVGGSTISQQLAKNLFLTPSKNPVRKVREAVYTWRMEQNLSKKRIIELYLNVAEWGQGIFGIEMAAQHHFGKSAAALSAMEAARLAAVLPNPRLYSPTGNSRYVTYRSEKIYGIMVRRGIVIEEYEEVLQDPRETGIDPAAGAPVTVGQDEKTTAASPANPVPGNSGSPPAPVPEASTQGQKPPSANLPGEPQPPRHAGP
ncbi:MAG: monofunctional biosynthetic peptidoglycan transglycosylase [Syntrophaceae bacterium]|nr:monofunctional biosynthetic peptidoglycan transglycosylase [Syntrophaceae bacterium]